MSDDRQELLADAEHDGRPVYPKLVKHLEAAQAQREQSGPLEEPIEALALVHDAWRANASDIHLDPLRGELLVRLRVDGVVLDATRLALEDGRHLINQFKTLARMPPGATLSTLEGRFATTVEEESVDLRVALVPCVTGEKMSLRLLVRRKVEQTIERLGLEDEDLQDVRGWLGNLRGMLLTAGPTGSGKTTTLYALLHQLKHAQRNILTIEDPVEYDIAGVNQIQVDLEHGLDFSAGIKALLRLDPDFLLVGEIRDRDSARAAVNAAASGRILMSTLHSHDAAGVIGVLHNYALGNLDIAPNLAMVIAQRLVRTLCPECRTTKAPLKRDREWLEALDLKVPSRIGYPQGCEACHEVGYAGRTGVFEVWRLDEEDYRLILERADVQKLRASLAERGHRTLLNNGLRKLKDGVISCDEMRSLSGFGPGSRFPQRT